MEDIYERIERLEEGIFGGGPLTGGSFSKALKEIEDSIHDLKSYSKFNNSSIKELDDKFDKLADIVAKMSDIISDRKKVRTMPR